MGRILRLHASFISTRKPSYNGLPMPLGQALKTKVGGRWGFKIEAEIGGTRSVGLVWFGLVWFGLGWFGLVWVGLG